MVGGRDDPLTLHLERTLTAAYRLARAILLDDTDAEDAVQDACARAWRQRSTLRHPDRVAAWFDRILINACRDRLRGRERQRLRAIAIERIETAQAVVGPGDGPDLDAVLDGLDLDHRLVVLLRYWQDLPLEAIAVRLDVPLGTVKSRLHYALRAMRARLEESDGRA